MTKRNKGSILAHAEVHDSVFPIELVGPALIGAAKTAKVPVAVHLDHGVSLEMIHKALRLGFTGVMIDASALPYAENLAVTKHVVETAHAMECDVEAELGRVQKGEGRRRGVLSARGLLHRPNGGGGFLPRNRGRLSGCCLWDSPRILQDGTKVGLRRGVRRMISTHRQWPGCAWTEGDRLFPNGAND